MTVATIKDQTEIKQVIADRQRAIDEERAAGMASFKYVRPLLQAADNYIDFVQNPHGRYMLGLHDIDVMTRGFARGELALFTGRTHEGKTMVVLNAIINNPDKRTLFFSLDEPVELVLAKLVAVKHNINSEELEARIKANDPSTTALVRRAATHDFRNLVVVDQPISLANMKIALDEAQQVWQQPCDVAAFDYLELFPGMEDGGEGVVAKAQGVKRWIKETEVVGLVIHQAKVTSGERGQSVGFSAARYGGNNEAIFGLEVYRKRDDESMSEWDRDLHRNTISINLYKNKRPPNRVGKADFYLEPATGWVRALRADDMKPSPHNQPAVRRVMNYVEGL